MYVKLNFYGESAGNNVVKLECTEAELMLLVKIAYLKKQQDNRDSLVINILDKEEYYESM